MWFTIPTKSTKIGNPWKIVLSQCVLNSVLTNIQIKTRLYYSQVFFLSLVMPNGWQSSFLGNFPFFNNFDGCFLVVYFPWGHWELAINFESFWRVTKLKPVTFSWDFIVYHCLVHFSTLSLDYILMIFARILVPLITLPHFLY